MNVRLVVDGIVRQTTVLIAQLATTAGVRAPLAHIANSVFLELAREIEAQGVGRKVAADMFGMALRAYQKKIDRLAESRTEANRTLWQAVLEYLREGGRTRQDVLERFRYDGEREVGAVLSDLVSHGLVYSTGRGETTLYRITMEADRAALSSSNDRRALEHLAWLLVFQGDAKTEPALAEALRVDRERASSIVEELIAERRLERQNNGTLSASNVVIPVGATEGFEAAILDHFRSVASAITAKAALGDAEDAAEVGGTTLTFSIYEGHPFEARVRGLLAAVRHQVHPLWEEVAAYNETHEVPADATRVSFYCGQTITKGESADPPPPGRA